MPTVRARTKTHHKAKVTEDQVILMRTLYKKRQALLAKADKLSIRQLADQFNCSFTLVRDAVFRKSWKHI